MTQYCCEKFKRTIEHVPQLQLQETRDGYSIYFFFDLYIRYCPWCAKSVPWKEIDDRES